MYMCPSLPLLLISALGEIGLVSKQQKLLGILSHFLLKIIF